MQNLSVMESLEGEHQILSTNGSREEEFLLFSMSQRGDFRMVGVACMVLGAVWLICWMPD